MPSTATALPRTFPSDWTDAEVSFAQQLDDANAEIRNLKAKIDGTRVAEVAELRSENECLREGLSAALEKLNQPDCDECMGHGFFTDRQGHRECPECGGIGRSWV